MKDMDYSKGKMDYSKDKKMYKENSGHHNPNDGENQIAYSGNTEYKRDESIADKAGVEDGLGSMEGISVKNAEMVTANQRPYENSESAGGPFKIGVS